MGRKYIKTTSNYSLFKLSRENRAVDLKKHRRLLRSMQKYGFIQDFPMVTTRDPADGLLEIREGQHRFTFAVQLGIPVHYVETNTEFDIAEINTTPKAWSTEDHARKHAANGLLQYQDGIDFAKEHGIALSLAFALLGGTTSFGNISEAFYDGRFAVKDRDWAEDVANVYTAVGRMSSNRQFKNVRFLEACMAVCRVPEFSADRLIRGASSCREKLIPYATKDAYLTMMEDLYNFRSRSLFGLKAAAVTAMRSRNAFEVKRAQAAARKKSR